MAAQSTQAAVLGSVAPPSSPLSASLRTVTRAAAKLVMAAPRDVFDQFDSRLDIYNTATAADRVRLSSGYLCLKVLLLAANLVTLIFGIVLLAVASYALTSQVPLLPHCHCSLADWLTDRLTDQLLPVVAWMVRSTV